MLYSFTSSFLECSSITGPQGFLRWLSGKESACQCRRCRFDPWVKKILWRRKWQPTPVFLPGKFHGQRNLVSYSPWGCIESNMTKQLSGEHAMHSQMQMGPQKVPAGFFFKEMVSGQGFRAGDKNFWWLPC